MARTEERIVEAAARMFLERGYIATTLTDVAAAAHVAARTVYVRFGTKASLLKRVIDVAIVSDTAPVDMLGREWASGCFDAPTLRERIAAAASASREIMSRTGALFEVGQQAAAVESVIAGFWAEGRADTLEMHRRIWTKAHDDGLMPAELDVREMIETASVVSCAETYLTVVRMHGWNVDEYEAWIRRTLERLAGIH